MLISYVRADRRPSRGDVKTLKNGERFIRDLQCGHFGFVVSHGRPAYEWIAYDDEGVAALRRSIETGRLKHARTSGASKSRPRRIHIQSRARAANQGAVSAVSGS